MIHKEPLNINVILELFSKILDNTYDYLQKAQQYDNEYGFDVVKKEKVLEIVNKFASKKLLYASEINEKIYYNYDKLLQIKLQGDVAIYDIVEMAIAVFLTQNQAVIYLEHQNKSASLDLVLNLLIKFAQSLKLYDNYLEIKQFCKNTNKEIDFTFEKQEDKLFFKRKKLNIEFDFNLLLQSY